MKLRSIAAFLLAATGLVAQSHMTMFPPVRGTHHIVAAANNFEVEAGYRILEQGGNAVDAGVATVLAAGVTELDHFGLGGEIPILIKLAGQPVMAISGIGTAPQKATVALYQARKPGLWENPQHMPPIPGEGILAAPVPGVFDGLILALDRYGTMSFAQVAAPAIEYADGFPITEVMANYIRGTERLLEIWPGSRAFFLAEGVPRIGQIFHETALASTLRALVKAEADAKGSRSARLTAVRDFFYKGRVAHQIANYSEAHGGLISYPDLAGFHAETDTPRSTTYRGYEVYKAGFWSQGPVLLECLNILEGFDLKAMGHNSPAYLHTVIEAVKLAFADRDRYYGDPKFSKIPEQTLLSKDYAAERRKLIDPNHASLEHRPGNLAPPLPETTTTAQAAIPARDTTCVNVVDSRRNMFSATPSGGWLPSVIAGESGIALSERMQTFVLTAGHPNQLQPGKRPRVTLSPTLVMKDGQPFLALSTPGGDLQDQTILQVLLNIIEFGMTPQEAVEAPRFSSDHLYTSFDFHAFFPGKLQLEHRFPQPVIDKLSAMGHRVTVIGDWGNLSAPTAILISGGALHGGADLRRGRFIFGR